LRASPTSRTDERSALAATSHFDVLILAFAAYLGFGLTLILVGANQAELARHYALDFENTGQLSSALALGIGVGVIGAGPLFDRYPTKPLFVGSLLLAAAALLSIDTGAGFARVVVHLFAAGAGIGGYNTVINATVAERFSTRSAKPMSVIHSGASVGAMLGPLLIGWLWAEDWVSSFYYTGATHAVLALCAALVPFPPRTILREIAGAKLDSLENFDEPDEPSPLSGSIIPFAGIAFAYVGIEASLVVFAIPYAGELGRSAEAGRIAISVFWMGLLLGRLSVLGRRAQPDARSLVTAGGLGSVVFAAGIGLGAAPLEALFGVVGFVLGSVYPVNMALTGQRFSRARGTAAGIAAGAGAFGGFAVPWWTGAMGDAMGIGAALFGLTVFTLLISVLSAWLRRAS